MQATEIPDSFLISSNFSTILKIYMLLFNYIPFLLILKWIHCTERFQISIKNTNNRETQLIPGNHSYPTLVNNRRVHQLADMLWTASLGVLLLWVLNYYTRHSGLMTFSIVAAGSFDARVHCTLICFDHDLQGEKIAKTNLLERQKSTAFSREV